MRETHPLKELKGKIRQEGSSYRKVSKAAGMSLKTFNNKINGYSAFDVDEAERIMKELHIELDDMARYFVPLSVETKQRRRC